MFEELATGVYAVHNRWVEGKSGVLVARAGTLVIDTCGYPDEGRRSRTTSGHTAESLCVWP